MNKLPYLIVVIIALYGLYNAYIREKQMPQNTPKASYATHDKTHQHKSHFEEELERIQTDEYARTYIINVINHGSDILDFPGGMMEGGFASKEDAPKIACYVLELSGKQCNESYPKDAAMFYTSICGGCHGDNGKGLNGAYPDLTRNTLLGIEKRASFLKDQIRKEAR